jgi:predicted metal-dependent hydrolase
MNLQYQLIHSDRRTIGITVERDRRVVVRAPQSAPKATVAAVVEKKRYWIWQKLRDPCKYPFPRYRKEFTPGETFLYLGQSYQLELLNLDTSGVQFAGNTFQLSRHERKAGQALFRAWFTAQAQAQLPPRVARLADSLGLDYQKIEVRDLRYRWASCTKGGSLIFNWRILQAPSFVIDYLIVHELAHLLETNHTPTFWNIVAVHAPSHAKARDWLRRHGDKLEW